MIVTEPPSKCQPEGSDELRWQRLKPLLEQALDLPALDRERFVSELPEELADLRGWLMRLLSSAPRTAGEADPLAHALAPSALAAALADEEGKDVRIGQLLGPYRVTRVLGSGGMGTVYVAQREDGGFVQEVALKVVEGAGLNSTIRARFERERQILAKLHHPNIALLFDGGETPEGLPYYTMELVDGPSIAEYCRTHVPTVEGRVRLLIKVATALAHAHKHLVVHRDIKPSNILISADGHVKLLDFGIAKLLGYTGEVTVTRAELGPMTREYAAPEQFHGGEITVATDVFQFGTLCYQILSGHLPYRADPGDPYEWSRAVSEEEPLPLQRTITQRDGSTTWEGEINLRQLKRQMRGNLDAIVRKAIAKAPQDRYRSMDAMISDLEAYLGGCPVTARRAGTRYYAWRFLARRPYGRVGAALAIAGLITTSLLALRQASIAKQEARRAQTEATHAHLEAARANAMNDLLVNLFKETAPVTCSP